MTEISIPDIPLKRCSKCKQLFPATKQYFFAHQALYDGLRPECKVCHFKRKKRINESLPEGYKRCTRCNRVQLIDEFGNFKQSKDGKRNFCKDCDAKARGKVRRVHFTKLAPRGYRRCTHCLAIKPNTLDYFIMGFSAAAGSICKDCKSRYDQRYREKLKFKTNQHPGSNADRLRRVTQLPNTLTYEQWERALEYFDHKCAVCGKPAGFWYFLAKDHWVPVTKNGATVADNIIPLCHGLSGIPEGVTCCNNSKSQKDPEQWLNVRFGKRRARVILARINAYFDWVREQDTLMANEDLRGQ